MRRGGVTLSGGWARVAPEVHRPYDTALHAHCNVTHRESRPRAWPNRQRTKLSKFSTHVRILLYNVPLVSSVTVTAVMRINHQDWLGSTCVHAQLGPAETYDADKNGSSAIRMDIKLPIWSLPVWGCHGISYNSPPDDECFPWYTAEGRLPEAGVRNVKKYVVIEIKKMYFFTVLEV